MSERRACPQCGSLMQVRLGNYECPGCGHRESEDMPSVLADAGPQLTDATAGAKLLKQREASIAQQAAPTAGTYNPFEKKAPKADTLRDEKIICLIIALVGLGYCLYYWLTTEDGQIHLSEFATAIKVTDHRSLSAQIIVGVSVLYLMCVAALFSSQKWLKAMMAVFAAALPLGCIAGIIAGGLAYNMFFSVAGFIFMVSGAVLLLVLGHDISHEATGV